MLLSSSDTRRTLMHLFLYTISAQRELVSICTQSINFPCISTLDIINVYNLGVDLVQSYPCNFTLPVDFYYTTGGKMIFIL